jgi:hypothetical protein
LPRLPGATEDIKWTNVLAFSSAADVAVRGSHSTRGISFKVDADRFLN